MSVEAYLGNPPENIKTWIQEHSQPPGHPETRFTLQNGTIETYNITGALDRQWMIDNGFFDENNYEWSKIIAQADIGNTVTSIGERTFFNNLSLTSIQIPNSIASIDDEAFHECTSLTSITMPNVMIIGYDTFSNCFSLKSVTIGNTVTSIGNYVFDYCSSLTSVTFEGKDRATVQGMLNYPFGLN